MSSCCHLTCCAQGPAQTAIIIGCNPLTAPHTQPTWWHTALGGSIVGGLFCRCLPCSCLAGIDTAACDSGTIQETKDVCDWCMHRPWTKYKKQDSPRFCCCFCSDSTATRLSPRTTPDSALYCSVTYLLNSDKLKAPGTQGSSGSFMPNCSESPSTNL
mgnify:CR=1 FL=1